MEGPWAWVEQAGVVQAYRHSLPEARGQRPKFSFSQRPEACGVVHPGVALPAVTPSCHRLALKALGSMQKLSSL